ncbi:hypothetical protein Tco_0353199 [Tanacetum coccineum]
MKSGKLHAYEMLQEFKLVFELNKYIKSLLQTERDYHSCKQEEGQSVSSYILKMKSYIDNLERLGNPVSLNLGSTQKQVTVALSSCESEFITATAAATQALWLKRLLSKLTHSQEEKVTIQVDNKSAIAQMKNPVFHERSKHIEMKYHFIRECVEKEDIQVKFINGEYQKADILTKALPKIKFLTMRQLIGLKDLRHSVCD